MLLLPPPPPPALQATLAVHPTCPARPAGAAPDIGSLGIRFEIWSRHEDDDAVLEFVQPVTAPAFRKLLAVTAPKGQAAPAAADATIPLAAFWKRERGADGAARQASLLWHVRHGCWMESVQQACCVACLLRRASLPLLCLPACTPVQPARYGRPPCRTAAPPGRDQAGPSERRWAGRCRAARVGAAADGGGVAALRGNACGRVTPARTRPNPSPSPQLLPLLRRVAACAGLHSVRAVW